MNIKRLRILGVPWASRFPCLHWPVNRSMSRSATEPPARSCPSTGMTAIAMSPASRATNTRSGSAIDGYGRVLAVTSVDGINVITGRTASPDQSGYVVESHGRVEIDGWRKSMDEVAAFYFTALPDSYAARTGRPDNVGVIGVALFREELAYAPMLERESAASADGAPAPAQKSSGAHEERARNDSRLGTGHGQRLDSGAVYTQFERASSKPDEIIRIYYDSRRNLVARGVIPRPHHRYAQRQPEPFPQAFVPDP